MKKIIFLALIFFVVGTTTSAFAQVTWSNLPPAGPVFPPSSATVSELISDFRVSAGVVLVADATVAHYGVAAANIVSGTRTYTTHSLNAQIIQSDPPVISTEVTPAVLQGLSTAAIADAIAGS